MSSRDQIIEQKKRIARCEKSLVLEKIKKRRADTRRKIELGGLVIKSGMDEFNKAIILGGLLYLVELMGQGDDHINIFEGRGNAIFLE